MDTPALPSLRPPGLIELLDRPADPALARGFVHRRVPARRLLAAGEGEADGVFVVLVGQLRVYLSCNGREFTLFYLEPGDIFSLHSGALIEAKQPSEILFADMASFERALLAVPSLALTVLPILGQTLRNAISIIEDQAFRDVRHRLLRWIVETAEHKGRPTLDGVVMETDLRTEDLAMLMGSTRQSVSVTLNQLLREGVVRRLSRTLMLVPDIARLKNELAAW